MSYKRVVKKKGKIYGPYIYESYRDENGKVQKRYLGKLEEKKNHLLLFILLGFLALALVIGGSYTTDVLLNKGRASETVVGSVGAFFSMVVDGVTGLIVDEGDEESEEEEIAEEKESADEEEAEEAEEVIEEAEEEVEELAEEVVEVEINETVEVEEVNETVEVVENVTEEFNETLTNETLVNETLTNETVVPEINLTEEVNDSVVIDLNETFEVNETFVNETLVDETIILSVMANASTLQYKAVINRPVKWIKRVDVSGGNVSVELPKGAVNISILTGEEVDEAIEQMDNFYNVVEEAEREDLFNGGLITGNVVFDIWETQGIFVRFWNWLTSFTISGNVIFEEEISESIIKLENATIVEISEIVSGDIDVAVEYYTEAPQMNETNLSNGKRVVVHAPDELNYTDILSYMMVDDLGMKMNDSRLKFYWYASKEDAIALGYITPPQVPSEEGNATSEIVEEVEEVMNVTEEVNETVVETNETIGVNETVIEENNVTGEINETVEVVENETKGKEKEKEPKEEKNKTKGKKILLTGDVVFGAGDNETFVVSPEDDSSKDDPTSPSSELNETVEEIDFVEEELEEELTLEEEVEGILNGSIPIEGIQIEVDYVSYDFDGDGYVDYIEWVVPHLSVQVYQIIVTDISDESIFLLKDVIAENNFTHLNISDVAPYDSLVLYMPFDTNTSATTVYDYSENDNDGVVYGGQDADSGFTTSGRFGGAEMFDNSGDYINVSDSTDFDIDQGLTLSMWYYKIGGGIDVLIDHNVDYLLIALFSEKIRFTVNNATAEDWCDSDFAIALNTWYHLSATYNGTHKVVYINGIINNTCSFTGDLRKSDSPLMVGASSTGITVTDGMLDEVMIFNTALTATEITNLYGNASARFKSSGTQTLKFQNISVGNSQFNLTAGFQNLMDSNISARVGYWNVSDGYNESDPANGLVSYWHFDETSWSGVTSDVIDSVGGNDGNASGGANTTSDSYMFGNVGSFDGDGDYVNISGMTNMGTTQSMWVKNVSDTSWYYVVNVSGTEYINGVTGSGRVIPISNSTGTVVIGDSFNGTIDEVMIYNRSLSADEVKELYIKGRASWTYSAYQNLTSYSEEKSFSISSTSTHVLPEFEFLVGSNNFYGPLLQSIDSSGAQQSMIGNLTGRVDACGTLDQANTVYTLQNDLSTTGTCLVIGANNITVDMSGYNIDGDDDDGDYGVEVNTYNFTTIKNGSITDFEYGIYLYGNNNNNTLRDLTSSSSYSGIYLNNSNNNTLINVSGSANTGSFSGGGYGIKLDTSDNNLLINITAVDNQGGNGGGGGLGLFVSDNNIIQNANLSGNTARTAYGLRLSDSDSNSFSGLTIDDIYGGEGSTGDNGISIYGSNNNITDSVITNVRGRDVIIGISEINNIFLNVSYSGTEVVFSGGELIRKWYYQAYVNDTNGNDVVANVTAYNASGVVEFSVVANATGWIARQEITEYTNISGTTAYYSNYSIVVTNVSYHDTNKSYNVTLYENKLDNVLLMFENATPSVTINLPENFTHYNDTTVLINASATDSANNVSVFNDYELISWWRMDDLNSTGGVVDYMGLNNGTPVGDAVQTDYGYMGKGFEFDGDGDYIDLTGGNPDFRFTNNFSISAWIRSDYSGSDVLTIFSTFSVIIPDESGYYLALNDSGSLEIITGNGGVGTTTFEAGGDLRDGNWHYVSFVFDWAETTAYLYSDGVLLGSDSSMKAPAGGGYEYIGAVEGPGGLVQEFNGSIDDVMIFNRSLSAAEVQALYANSTTKYLNSSMIVSEGSHDITFYTQDGAGNVGSALADDIVVDTTFPTAVYGTGTDVDGDTKWVDNIFVNVSASDTYNVSVVVDFNNSLVSWWRMDDVDALGDPQDYMGRNHGFAEGGAVKTDVGKLGKGFEFDGVNDYVNLSNPSSLQNLNNFTISLWVYPKSLGVTQRMLSQYDGDGLPGDGELLFSIMSSNVARFVIDDNSYNVDSTTTIQTNAWYHIVASIVADDKMNLYINGINESQKDISALASPYIHTSSNLIIGGVSDVSDNFNGTIDDVMIFNRTLSAAEIQALYANVSQRYVTINYTDLEDGPHTFRAYVQDLAGNVNNSLGLRTVTTEVGTNVTHCRYLTQANTVYTMQKDITATGNCLIINASNVTLDGNGYAITGNTSGDAILTIADSDLVNLTIKDFGNISNFTRGIYFDRVNDSLIVNNSMNSEVAQTTYAIYLEDGDSNVVENNSINWNATGSGKSSYGVYLRVNSGASRGSNNITGNNIAVNSSESSAYGVYLYNSGTSNSNTIQSNTIDVDSSSTGYGVYLNNVGTSMSSNLIYNETIDVGSTASASEFKSYGVWLADADSTNVSLVSVNATASSAYAVDIYLSGGSDDNIFYDNTLLGGNWSTYIVNSGGTNNTFVNVSYGGGEFVGTSADLTRKWYYRAYVNDTSGSPVVTNVTAINSSGSVEWSVMTQSDLGSELVTNGDFATGSDWIKDSAWIISGGGGIYSGDSGADLTQSLSISSGAKYNVTYKIISIAFGGPLLRPVLGGTNGATRNTVGNYSEIITAGSDDTNLIMRILNAIDGGLFIDDVSVKEVRQRIPKQEITDYVNSAGTVSYYSYYTINASNSSYIVNNHLYNVTANENKLDNYFLMEENVVPSLTVNLPANDTHYATTTTLINASATDVSSNVSVFNDYGLVSWWRMDDVNASGIVLDYMKLNNGTPVGDAVQTDYGYMGKGFSFDGDDDYIDLTGDNPDFRFTNNFSISAWIKSSGGTGVSMSIFSTYFADSISSGYYLHLNDSGALVFIVGSGGGSSPEFGAGGDLRDGNWHHVSVVYDWEAITAHLYSDGVLVGSGSTTVTPSGSSDEYIGAILTVVGVRNFFNGTIDDVLIFNRSLSAAEVQAMYANQTTKYLNSSMILPEGTTNFNYYAQDGAGNVVSAAVSEILVDTVFPNATYGVGTDSDGDTKEVDNIFVNVSVNDSNNVSTVINFNNSLVSWWRMDDVGGNNELVTDGGFASDLSSWTVTSAWEWNSGQAQLTGDEEGNISQDIGVVAGHTYNLTYTLSMQAYSARFRPYIGGVAGTRRTCSMDDCGTVTYSELITATDASDLIFDGYINAGERVNLDNVSVVDKTVIDYMARNNGVVYGDAVQTDAGKMGKGMSFDGDGDYIEVTVSQDKNSTSFWYKNSTSSYWTYVASNGTAYFVDGTVGTPNEYPLNISGNTVKIGVNGSTYFNGIIDDVLIFNRSLSAEEILGLYANTSSRYLEINYTGLANGAYTFRAYTQDLSGNVNDSLELRTVSIDTTAPTVTIDYPSETTYANYVTDINYTVVEADDRCWYSINGGTFNYSDVAFDVNWTGLMGNSSKGSNTWDVWCNDSAGNFGSDSVTFTVDNTNPTAVYGVGTDETGSMKAEDSIFVNVSVSDATGNVSTVINFNNSLVSWWRMDDVNSTHVLDYMKLNNGTIVNAVQTDEGKLGKGFEFDGDGDYVDLTSAGPAFDFTNNFSISAWIKSSHTGSDNLTIFSNLDVSIGSGGLRHRGYFIGLNGSGNLGFSANEYSTVIKRVYVGGSDLRDGNWHQVNAVYDYGTTTVYLYVDGVLLGSDSAIDSPSYGGEGTKEYIGVRDSAIGGSFVSYFNGTIDDVMLFNRSLSAEEIVGLYANTSRKYTAINYTNLPDGVYTFRAYTQDSAGNVNDSLELRTITTDITAPDDPEPVINFSGTENITSENVVCSSILADVDGGPLNVTVKWYINNTLNLTQDFNNTYVNGTAFGATLLSGNTTKHNNWSCGMRTFDGIQYSNWVNTSFNVTVLNDVPVVTLAFPTNRSATTNRTIEFNWTVSDDDAEDSHTYDFNLTSVLFSGADVCSEANVFLTGQSSASYTPSTVLTCLWDNGYYYSWTVRANDSEGYGDWTSNFTVNITAGNSFVLTNDSMNFGTMAPLAENDTLDDSPFPFRIENDGTVLINISVNASALWDNALTSSSYFQFKADNVTGEESAFDWLGSITSWFNIPITGEVVALKELNYVDSKDSAEIDIRIEVPPNEEPAAKGSVIVFYSRLAE